VEKPPPVWSSQGRVWGAGREGHVGCDGSVQGARLPPGGSSGGVADWSHAGEMMGEGGGGEVRGLVCLH
jgi:hypothetical protein